MFKTWHLPYKLSNCCNSTILTFFLGKSMDHSPKNCSDFQFGYRCFNFHNWPLQSFNFFQFRYFWFFFSKMPSTVIPGNHCAWFTGITIQDMLEKKKKNYFWGHFGKKRLNWKKLKPWGDQLWKLKHQWPNWKAANFRRVICTFSFFLKGRFLEIVLNVNICT